MTNIHDLSVSQLRHAVEIKEKIETLNQELASIGGGGAAVASAAPADTSGDGAPAKRRMSARARAKIRAGQLARWARRKGNSSPAPQAPAIKRRKVSAAVRALRSEIAKKRWAAARAAGRRSL